jgi:2-keto-4-pentenoate hydratase/2-oxohepta-3-ene-1,7-dioic acid hydratase in catechol pathway
VSVADAKEYILGYTCGNDLTSRLHQDPGRSGGQFTYAKGFDKFAPIGPYLVPPDRFSIAESSIQVRVNGKVMQDSPLDFVFSPEEILSLISQGQ